MNDNTMLLRQIHPNFVQNDKVSSQAFRPTTKDNERLSVYDGDRFTAISSYQHYTANHKSVGVMGVTIEECSVLGLIIQDDPSEFPGHAVIDFSGLTKTAIEKKSKQLKVVASQRNWLYRGQ